MSRDHCDGCARDAPECPKRGMAQLVRRRPVASGGGSGAPARVDPVRIMPDCYTRAGFTYYTVMADCGCSTQT